MPASIIPAAHQRSAIHRADPALGEYRFVPEYGTNSWFEQRALGQVLFDRNPGAQKVNGGLNKIRAVRVAKWGLFEPFANGFFEGTGCK